MPKAMPSTTEAKLDEIIAHLRKLDARDRLRTWGGFVRSLIALIPVLLLLWSVWYFVQHGADFMKMIADQAASSAAEATKSQGSGLYEQLMKQYNMPRE